jgi:hypothetical protein
MYQLFEVEDPAPMQAALISYAMFTAVFLLLVIIVIIIVAVRSLLTFIRGPRAKDKNGSSGQPLNS